MKHIAVAGMGAIGSIVGGKLALAGRDVTLICTGWRENLEYMKSHGLTVTDGVVEETTAVTRALHRRARPAGRTDRPALPGREVERHRALPRRA